MFKVVDSECDFRTAAAFVVTNGLLELFVAVGIVFIYFIRLFLFEFFFFFFVQKK